MTYAAAPDPYCYPGSAVLKNLGGITDQPTLDAFEARAYKFRALQSLPTGRFSVTHYQAFHRHLFGDVYAWASRYRTVRISKGNSMFCYPENIAGEMKTLFAELRSQQRLRGRDRNDFATGLASFLATLNAIHPFREGNGRTQLAFASALADHAQHPLDFDKLEPAAFLDAMIKSFNGDEAPLANCVFEMIKAPDPQP